MVKLRKVLSILLIIVMLVGIFAGCGSDKKSYQSMEDFSQAKIGVLTGSAFDRLADEYFPEAEKLNYINITDLILNLERGKINGILMDKGFYTPLAWEGVGLSYVKMDMPAIQYAVAFPNAEKSEHLKNQMNEFISVQTENGGLAELEEKWLSDTQPDGTLDFSQLSGKNGILRVATSLESKPFDFLADGQFCGFDADFIFRFAEEYGYALEIETMDFGALLPSLEAGRYDLAISSITVTEERKETVLLSEPYHSSAVVMAILQDEAAEAEEHNVPKTLASLKTATIGVVTGTNWDKVVQENFPNAERKYFTSTADALLALQQGKVDAFFADKTVYAGMRWENGSITYIDEPVETISNALIFAKDGYNEKVLAQVNEFIEKSEQDGTLNRLAEKWFGNTEPEEHPDYTQLNGENGILHIAVGDSMMPTAYQKGELYTGYEVEFLTLFAQEYGYRLEMQGVAFDALIPLVATGKCDIGACGITITPERATSVTFSDSHFETYGVAVVLNDGEDDVKTLSDFKHARIGIQTGSVFEAYAKEMFPDAERLYYTLLSDMILAMEQGKIDGFICETLYVVGARWEGAKIEAVEGAIAQTEAGYIFPLNAENEELLEQLNTFIRDKKESGFLDELREKWFGDTEPTELFDRASLTGENGTLKVIACPDLKPMIYMKNGEVVGYDIEVLLHFAKEYGYDLEFVTASFDGIVPGVVSGKYDIGAAAITITEERAQSVAFSESYLLNEIVMVANETEDTAAKTGFWDDLKEDFQKTFVRENRWKLILDGTCVTLLISISAMVLGTLLGFGLYMLSRTDVALLQTITKAMAKVYSRIVAGTPVLVILMILFYVIFGKVRDMSGVLVAIIGFTLTFGAFVYDHMTVSVNSVDRGQTEAAYALGYTKNQTFFRIIFPQAMTIFLPSYCGQAVELVKATAVVGYVAVNDLTKMGDIIRSNTYEAFFPLFATAVIYFLLTWVLSLLLGLVKIRFEPKRRSKEQILKGVKTK